MADDKSAAPVSSPPQDLKKPGRRTEAVSEPLRRTVRAVSEVFEGAAEATADAFKGLNDTLEGKAGASLAEDLIEGLAEGNARFLERMAKASREAAGQLRRQGEPVPAIDYEKLARHVAAELKKDGK